MQNTLTFSNKIRIACGAGWAALAAALPVHAQSAASSEAYGFSAKFVVNGQATLLAPVGQVKGSAPPAYKNATHAKTDNESLFLFAGTPPIPELVIDALGIKSQATSSGIAIDSVSATANTAIKTFTLSLIDYPPPPVATASTIPFPEPFLNINASDISAAASYSLVFPSAGSTDSQVSFGSLSIGGTLVGSRTLTFSGIAAPNTVLYDSPTVTITLDQELTRGTVDCINAQGCSFVVGGIEATAIDIALRDAVLNGTKVSGHILIGRSAAD